MLGKQVHNVVHRCNIFMKSRQERKLKLNLNSKQLTFQGSTPSIRKGNSGEKTDENSGHYVIAIS